MANTASLICRQLVKVFDGTRAVDGLDLTVETGTIFGLLGPNGSGKTTTIRTSLGIYKPDGGSVEILASRDPLAVRHRTGYLPEERGLYAKMKLREQLAFLASIRGLSLAESDRRAGVWLDRVGLAARAQSLTRELSKGMQQKVQFAAAVIHDPDLVVLDEPYSGLDPVNSRLLKELILVEEKSSRLIEVILGAVTATEFMAGKILGVLGSGLTQLAIWIAVSLVAILQAVPALGLAASTQGFDISAVLSVRLIFYFAVFFSLGYLLYSVLFAVVAVTCTSTEELGQSMMAASLPMVIALMAALSVIANPDTTMTRVLSLIPFFTPLVMLARVNVLMPPLWEVWSGVAIVLATSAAAGWVAAKIFRYALLMTGKRPTLPELMRVVRAG